MGTFVPGARPWRRLIAALVLPLVLAGVVEVHNHGLAPSRAANLGLATHFSPEAVHPNQPCHFEESSEGEAHECAACLHSLSARGLQVSLAPALRATVSGERPPCAQGRIPSDPLPRWVGGRSPPFA
ncbi:MAG TPA: hypothetical protein VGS07_23880 [Thermoanaerobaculia bacterium]|nr:hypothetical protein [Thermoanaerobaculia bacterium]